MTSAAGRTHGWALKLVGDIWSNIKVSPQIVTHCCGGFDACPPVLPYALLQAVSPSPPKYELDSGTRVSWLDCGEEKTVTWQWRNPADSTLIKWVKVNVTIDKPCWRHVPRRAALRKAPHFCGVLSTNPQCQANPEKISDRPTTRNSDTWLVFLKRVKVRKNKAGPRSCHRAEETKETCSLNVMTGPGAGKGH